MLGAFMTQFPHGSLVLHVEPFVQTESRLREILDRANHQGAAVCHAMVSIEYKRLIADFCKVENIPCRDLTGGMVEFLSEVTGLEPNRDMEALHRLDEAYRRRIGAMEFTLAHDDGLGTETLSEADIVLAGVSRTSKTPTSIYLAQQGYRVANVALAHGINPPPQLLAMPPQKVIGLLIDPQQLVMIRAHREQDWGPQAGDYGDPEYVARELTWARRLYNDRGWKSLNVTDQAIEETAARIVALVGSPVHTGSAGHFCDLEL